MKIDPKRTWKKVEERLAVERDPRLRRNLEVVLAHMKAEATLDMDALMATVSEKAHYHAYGTDDPLMNPEGKAAVLGFYRVFAASGAQRLMLDVDRLVVDRDCVVTEGVMCMAYPGSTLQAMGRPVDDPDACYLYETRMAILWPFDADGLILGEDSYTGGDGFAGIESRKLAPEEIGSPSVAA